MSIAMMRCYNQKQMPDGSWQNVELPDGMCLSDVATCCLYGWLADVRNYSAITPLSSEYGLPDGINSKCECTMHGVCDNCETYYDGYSWRHLSVDVLRAVNFNEIVEDRRTHVGNRGDCTCPEGEGEKMPLHEFLGEYTMRRLNALIASDADRIVFAFD